MRLFPRKRHLLSVRLPHNCTYRCLSSNGIQNGKINDPQIVRKDSFKKELLYHPSIQREIHRFRSQQLVMPWITQLDFNIIKKGVEMQLLFPSKRDASKELEEARKTLDSVVKMIPPSAEWIRQVMSWFMLLLPTSPISWRTLNGLVSSYSKSVSAEDSYAMTIMWVHSLSYAQQRLSEYYLVSHCVVVI